MDNWGGHWLMKNAVNNWRRGVIRAADNPEAIETADPIPPSSHPVGRRKEHNQAVEKDIW